MSFQSSERLWRITLTHVANHWHCPLEQMHLQVYMCASDCMLNVNVMWPLHCRSSMKVLRGASRHRRASVSAVGWERWHWTVKGKKGTRWGSWDYDWRHLVTITNSHSTPGFFQTHSPPGLLFHVFFFPSAHTCANLRYILRWHVFPKLVLLLIRLVLENQTKHDTALHYLAWWCHDVMNTTLTLLTLCPHLPSMCQSLVSHKQVCVCTRVNQWHFLEVE